MRTIAEDLQNHLNGSVHKLAYFWKVTRTDSVVLGFTSHTENVVIDEVTYEAATGYQASQISQTSNLSTDGLDILGVLDSEGLAESDLIAGKYDFAEIEVFLANYENPSLGTVTLKRGWLGQVKAGDNNFTAELRSLTEALNLSTVGKIFMPTCQATLGDSDCGVNLASFTETGEVTTVVSNREFTDTSLSNASDYFNFGVLTWTSGSNNGLKMEVKDWNLSTQTMKLMLPMPYDIEAGDTYTVHAGCDKSRNTCLNTFNNLDNFRFGYPDLPGLEKLWQHA